MWKRPTLASIAAAALAGSLVPGAALAQLQGVSIGIFGMT